ncbi:TolC family protein [Rhodopirellula sallentina]|uniref:TolC family protein n=1 Tax=Rhodopirellula sallentina TaxID=1263869 RepID=UPI001F1A3385|nr:TolC family protein [Rhodopirellula sallentina]
MIRQPQAKRPRNEIMVKRSALIAMAGLVSFGCASKDVGRTAATSNSIPVATAAVATSSRETATKALSASDNPHPIPVIRLASAKQNDNPQNSLIEAQSGDLTITEVTTPEVGGAEVGGAEDKVAEDAVAEDNVADGEGQDANLDDSLEFDDDSFDSEQMPPPLLAGASDVGSGLPLQDVVASVQSYFPMLQVAYLERNRTSGDQLAAWGEFDTKLKARSESQPLGFYENYQNGLGVYQPLYRGGEIYSGYRIGRGVFEPWYQERQTNEGGEFKAGFQLPLLRDKNIDARRADLWRATYDRQMAEPEIRDAVIQTIRDASIAYWIWVASGRQVKIGEAALELAERRNRQVARRVEEGDLGEPVLADNQRAIMQRKGKLTDLRRKRTQTAVKLSLFLRDGSANPRIPAETELPDFPEVVPYDLAQLNADIQYAAQLRPELTILDTQMRKVRVDLAEACNETLPVLDAFSNVSQDVGEPTSSKRDKSELELEVGFEFEMPVQRRKGLGKMRSARAKLNQIAVKRQYTIEKISTEVQTAVAALDAAYQRVQQIADSVEISEKLAQVERRKFELGESDLLAVFLREQIAIEAASDLVAAKLEYFAARADYTAALAYEYPVTF